MATTKSFSEITEIANTLHNDFAQLRQDALNRYQLYTLRKEPVISEDISREGQVNILSPLIIHSAHTIRADLMMNPTEFICIPLARERGSVPNRDATRADNLEKALAIVWSQLNEGRRLDKEIIWHQLVSPFGVMLLEANDIAPPDQPEGMEDKEYLKLVERHKRECVPWKVSTPDPLTCSFLEHNGQLTLFVRRYKMLVKDVRTTYSRRRGTDKSEKDLIIKDGRWQWQEMSEDYTPETFHQGTEDIKEVEMIWMDDGVNIYHVALNQADRQGEVVWSGKNPFGRVSAFVVGSNTTPLRKPEDRWEPYLWSLMQTVNQINVVRTTRATSARNESGPDNYIVLDPQTIQLFVMAGKELPKLHKWQKDETPYLLGPVQPRPTSTSPDFDKLEMQLNQELQRYVPASSVNVLDPAVLKAATASAILHAAEAGIRMYGPLMSAYDSAIKDMMAAILHSAQYYYEGEEFFFYATGDEMAKGVPIKEGSMHTISGDSLDFSYRLNVKTRSMTQAQASAQYELALKQRILPDGSPGVTTMDDLIDAANFSDKEAQKKKIAEEQILKQIDPYLQQMALAGALVEIEYRTGMKLPIGGDQAAAAGGGPAGPGGPAGGPPGGGPDTPSRLPNSAQRMDAPFVTGPQGGSDPGTEGFGGQ